jgi:two-component system cell cycle response regulator
VTHVESGTLVTLLSQALIAFTVVICPDMPSVEAAVPVAERISESLRTSLVFADGELQTSATVGVAWTNETSVSPDALIARADTAMYQSKLDRVGSVVVAEKN